MRSRKIILQSLLLLAAIGFLRAELRTGVVQAGSGVDEKFDFGSSRRARQLVVERAAAVPKNEMPDFTKEFPPKLEDYKNQPLTLFILYYKPPPVRQIGEETAKRRSEEVLLDPGQSFDPAGIFKAISKWSKGPSFIQPDYIQKVTAEIKDGAAHGVVEIEVKDVYRLKVNFVAKKSDSGWKIERFAFPGIGAEVISDGDNGRWKYHKIEDAK